MEYGFLDSRTPFCCAKPQGPAGPASTLNQKSFAASLRSDRQKCDSYRILSVSPRLLKYLKRCGLVWIYARAIFTPLPRHGGPDSYRVSTFTQTAIAIERHRDFSSNCLRLAGRCFQLGPGKASFGAL
jgi:hypothetical protein